MTARRLRLILLLSTAVLLRCARSQPPGDWRYARWGMTEAEVAEASQGSTVPAAPEDQAVDRTLDSEVRLKAPVSWIGQSFVAFFGFNRRSHRLSSVTLQLQNGPYADVVRLRDALNSRYGSPTSSMKRDGAELIVWLAGSEQVGFVRMSNPAAAIDAPVASVSYQPRSGR